MWDLPGPGIEPMSRVLAGGFLTTVPPEKSQQFFLNANLLFLDEGIFPNDMQPKMWFHFPHESKTWAAAFKGLCFIYARPGLHKSNQWIRIYNSGPFLISQPHPTLMLMPQRYLSIYEIHCIQENPSPGNWKSWQSSFKMNKADFTIQCVNIIRLLITL